METQCEKTQRPGMLVSGKDDHLGSSPDSMCWQVVSLDK